MADNKNDDLDLNGVLNEIKQNDVVGTSKKNTNENNLVSSKEDTKSKIIHIRLSTEEIERLKSHLKDRGYDAFSTGVKYIIRKYMKDNNIWFYSNFDWMALPPVNVISPPIK